MQDAKIAHTEGALPGAAAADRDARFNDWRWQLRNSVTSVDALLAALPQLADHPRLGGGRAWQARQKLLERRFRMAVSPYYLQLIDPTDPDCPVLQQILPDVRELDDPIYTRADPLAEDDAAHMPVRGLTHRYPDRALWYITHRCAVYCRFCFRKRKVSQADSAPDAREMEAVFQYLKSHPEIQEVILSGGDPLSLSDARLARTLQRLRSIPHLASLRIHTRMPVALPMRITDELLRAFESAYPLTLVTHFNHPRELSDAARAAVRRLRGTGVHVLNQSVLLSGINDDVATQADLLRGLLRAGVQPYYLHRCDEVAGVSHFRAPLERGVEILRELRGRMPGIALPRYVVDLPGGGGKAPLEPDYLVSGPSLDGESSTVARSFRFRNFEGRIFVVED